MGKNICDCMPAGTLVYIYFSYMCKRRKKKIVFQTNMLLNSSVALHVMKYTRIFLCIHTECKYMVLNF